MVLSDVFVERSKSPSAVATRERPKVAFGDSGCLPGHAGDDRKTMSGRHEKPDGSDGFDAFALAERRLELAGTIDLKSLPRVAERLADAEQAPLAWRIAGVADAVGRPALALSLEGRVPLTCQRCLKVFSSPVAQRTVVLLARDEHELARLDDDDEHEVVLAAAPLQVQDVVEEEVLLALPFVPRCSDLQCAAGASRVEIAPAPVQSAFAALAALRPEPGKGVRSKHRK